MSSDEEYDNENDEITEAEYTQLLLRHLMQLTRRGRRNTEDSGDESEAAVIDSSPEATKHLFEHNQARNLRNTEFAHRVKSASCMPALRKVDRPTTPAVEGAAADADAAGDGSGAGEQAPVRGSSARVHVVAALDARRNGTIGIAGSRRRTAGSGLRGELSATDEVEIASRYIPCSHSGAIRGGGRAYNGQFSKSGDLFMAAWQSNQLVLFDTRREWVTEKVIETRDVQWTVTSVDLSPDEQFVIYSSMSERIHLCNVKGEYEMHQPMDMTSDRTAIFCAKFSPGGNEVIAGTSNHSLLVYDVERNAQVDNVRGHEDDVCSVAYIDSTYRPFLIGTASDDHLVKIWDRRTLGSSDKAAGVLPGHSEGLTHIVGKGDGRYVLTNCKDQSAKLWDLRMMYSHDEHAKLPHVDTRFHWDYRWMEYPGWGRPYKHPHDRSIMTYRGHTVLNTLIRCYFSPVATTGQRYVYSASQCGSVFVYDALTGEIVKRHSSTSAPVRDVSWHPYKPIISAAAWDGRVWLYNYRPDDMTRDRDDDSSDSESD